MQNCHGELLQHAHRTQYGGLKFRHGRIGKIIHARVSRADDAISFNQPSPTHDRRRLPRYSRQATIISAGYDYPLVGLTHRHGYLPLVSLIEERKTPICSTLRCLKPFSIPSQIYFSRRGDFDGKCLVFSFFIKQTVVDIQPNSHLLLPQHLSSVCTFLKDEHSKILSPRWNNHSWLPWTQ